MAHSASTRSYMARDARVSSQPTDRNYVRYTVSGALTSGDAAQFGDISVSGMRLISRMPTKTKVGDQVDVQFSLPGSRFVFKGRALVVRKVSEFEFAVKFMNFAETQHRALQVAINEYLRYLRMSPLAKKTRLLADWSAAHRNGLLMALTGLLILGGTFAVIYMTSDSYQGRELKSWGKSYPREWDWDYVNKFHKNK